MVTGGAGYVGTHICKALSQAGYHPIILDDLSRGNNELVKYGKLFVGSIEDVSLISKIHAENHFDDIIHCAAYAYVGESIENPMMYYENNVVKSIRMLNTVINLGVRNIVFSSSCATYATHGNKKLSVDASQSPNNPYGRSKLFVEEIIRDYSVTHDLNYVFMRYFNVAGADPTLEIGERHDPETHLIPLLIKAIFDDDFVFAINGNDYATSDGTCVRDFVHVSDLAKAHVLALIGLHDQQFKNTAFNIGSMKGFSIMEIIKCLEKITGKKVKYKVGPRRIGDPDVLIADPQQAQERLGWHPQYSTLHTILETAVDWYEKEKFLGTFANI